jgi:serine/threonine-protein kinase
MRANSRAETEPFERGQERFGPYLVQERIDDRGLATVHRAVDTRLDETHELALKRLHGGFASEWELVDAFLHEAKLASQLNHPHIAATYSFGKIEGTFYAATELVRGPTLDAIIRQSRSAAGAIPVEVVVELMIQLCEALHHLHGATPTIIHRGLAPATMMVSREGHLKLTDLGLAKTAARRATRRGVLKGTIAYIAPESVTGDIDPRGDLFAVGAIAHELLVGRPLFAAASEVATVHNVCTKVVAPPSRSAPNIPRELDHVVLTALQRDPADRWQCAADLVSALRPFARERGGRAWLVQRVREWLNWAFERKPRHDSSGMLRLLESLD